MLALVRIGGSGEHDGWVERVPAANRMGGSSQKRELQVLPELLSAFDLEKQRLWQAASAVRDRHKFSSLGLNRDRIRIR